MTQPMPLRAIEPEEYAWFPYKGHTFCLGLADGRAAWTSGQSSAVFDPEVGKSVVGGTMSEQAHLSYTKLLDVLAEAGLTADDVVHVVENVTAAGMPDYEAAAAVREEVFSGRPVAVTTVAVDRLVRGRALIEIELHGLPGGGTPFGEVRGWTRAVVREGHHGTVHLPTVVPVSESGEVVAPGDAPRQYAFCLEQAAAALESAGLGPQHVVSMQEYVAHEARGRLAELAEVRDSRWDRDAAGGTVVMERLHRPGVEVAVDVTASRSAKQVVDPGWGRFAELPMVPAVEAGGVLYLSAIASLDPHTGELVHANDLEAQAEEVYQQLIDLVRFGGGEPASVRSTIEFCVADRIGEYRAVAGVRKRLLSEPWPASTGDLCTAFPVAGALIQTTAIAHRI
jgi:enamine deaminase RidA (YjgF/YER057c/UK114 family)